MKFALSVVAIGTTLTATGLAQAQPTAPQPAPAWEPPSTSTYSLGAERPSIGTRIAAPKDAFELSIGTGYAQGFGSLRSGVGMPSVATPGAGVELGLGYRIDPHWAVLWSGEYNELRAERADTARMYTSSLSVHYHFAPMSRADTWFSLGAGYRALWEEPVAGPRLVTHGIQLARARLGIDFRASEGVALGPVIGGDATMFLFQDTPNLDTNIADPRVSAFVFAGLQGRFDVGGSTSSSTNKPPPTVSMR